MELKVFNVKMNSNENKSVNRLTARSGLTVLGIKQIRAQKSP